MRRMRRIAIGLGSKVVAYLEQRKLLDNLEKIRAHGLWKL
jgi:hypothetical protein